MRDGWVAVTLGDVATLDIDRVPVEPDHTYSMAGLNNEGKGVFRREDMAAEDTNYKHFHRLRAYQVVLRKLTAWEGAIAVVPPELDGHYASTEFPTFTLDRSRVDPAFASLLFQRPEFWQKMLDRSTGTVMRRKRLSPTGLLSIPVWLPTLGEQRRIVDFIAAVDGYAETLRRESAKADAVSTALMSRAGQSDTPRVETTLGELVTFVTGKTPPRDDASYWSENLDRPFCTIADMSGWHVRPRREGVTAKAEEEGKAKRFPAGSLLMSFKLTLGRVGFAEVDLFPNEAIVWLRPTNRSVVDERWLALAIEAQNLHEYAGRAVKGNTLNRGSLKAIPLHVPPIEEQRRIAEDVLAARELASSAAVTEHALQSLRASLCEGLLSGRYEIPSSYDRFLEDVS